MNADNETRLRNALRKLVARIDEVRHSDNWKAVWAAYHEKHGPDYWGPTFDKALDDAREALKES
jgi:hypothetical protein